MPDEKNANGKKRQIGRHRDRIKEDLNSLKTDLLAKAKEQFEGLKNPTKTQLYTSIFRHKHDDTPRIAL